MSNSAKKRFTSFTVDEELAEHVKHFPCVYSKSAPSYKERHVEDAWEEKALNLQSMEDGKYFASLKSLVLFSDAC